MEGKELLNLLNSKNVDESDIKEKIIAYFAHPIHDYHTFIKICTTLFHRIITSRGIDNNEYQFLNEQYDKFHLIKNTSYIDLFIRIMRTNIPYVDKESITLINNELDFIKEEMSKENQDIDYIYAIKEFASLLYEPFRISIDYAAIDGEDIKDITTPDKCLDIVIYDITKNIQNISEEDKEKIVNLISKTIKGFIFSDNIEFVTACETMLNLDGRKEVLKLLKETELIEAKLNNDFPEDPIKPIYTVEDIKNRHHK